MASHASRRDGGRLRLSEAQKIDPIGTARLHGHSAAVEPDSQGVVRRHLSRRHHVSAPRQAACLPQSALAVAEGTCRLAIARRDCSAPSLFAKANVGNRSAVFQFGAGCPISSTRDRGAGIFAKAGAAGVRDRAAQLLSIAVNAKIGEMCVSLFSSPRSCGEMLPRKF